jgi:Ca-activated chloride channel family protein
MHTHPLARPPSRVVAALATLALLCTACHAPDPAALGTQGPATVAPATASVTPTSAPVEATPRAAPPPPPTFHPPTVARAPMIDLPVVMGPPPSAEAKAAGADRARAEFARDSAGAARLQMLASPYSPPLQSPVEQRDRYAPIKDNGVFATAQQPFSTFSVDVDTASYANIRRILNRGELPPPDAVRVEELINYFPYHYDRPTSLHGRPAPFGVTTEVAATPWNRDTLLVRVGIKAYDRPSDALPPANFVFLVDVSGSMDEPDKLPLLKKALQLMVDGLRAQDHVSLVTYASGTRIVLQPTSGRDKAAIRVAIDQLVAGGSTAGAAGIQLAYRMAELGFVPDGINRILLATDGDFNVGLTDFAQLRGMVEQKRRSGVSLSTLGFGEGNLNDELMEQLADAGDGNYSYIDTLNEARKVLVEQASSTFSIVARDVKVQMEFNPAVVGEYRLIGYEDRLLAREDFRNDKIDAGEIGAGHTVTALYEVSLAGHPGLLGESRYGRRATSPSPAEFGNELAMLRLRYKTPDGSVAEEIATPVNRSATTASEDLRFAAAVAAFGQELRGGKHLGHFGYAEIAALAAGARGQDRYGYRGEFLRLVELANALSTQGSRRVGRAD